jgi:hypothetical protein
MTMIRSYLEELPARRAEYRLMLAGPLRLPHMERDDQRRLIRNWERAAGIERKAQTASRSQLAAIGVKVEYA